MIRVVDIVYSHHSGNHTPQQILDQHRPALGFADFIYRRLEIQFVKHLEYEGIEKINGIVYAFFKGRNGFWHIPRKTHRYIKSQHPDIVIVEGLIFPLQLILLKLELGSRCRIVAQHHGEKPFNGIKGLCQKIADRCISAYLFTSKNNAAEWIAKKIIRDAGKCKELLEASTHFLRKEKLKSQAILGIKGTFNFLWVGRLDSNKDPFTVLKAFEKYALFHPDAKLYMIYQEDTLLAGIINLIKRSVALKQAVVLIGKVDHSDLEHWYSAVDFFISGSHKEGSGYALLEAMACGCIPVVTAIPPFEKITLKGKYGFLYPPGDAEALTALLYDLANIDIVDQRDKIEKYFHDHLSFKNIAENLYTLLNQL